MIGQGVTLITGLPGSGKTALVVEILDRIKDRPLFVMGIPELKIEHNVCPPVDQWVEQRTDPDDSSLKLPYFTFPPNSIVVLDEAQRVYRPRPTGSKVPDIVAAFETRRHTGVDFVLLTQHPTFVDVAIRKLTQRHIHIHCTTLGRYKLEWQGVGEPDDKRSRDLAARVRYKPNKRIFDLYKSAELHTKPVVKRPWYMYAFIPLVLTVIAAGFYVKDRIDQKMHPQSAKQVVPATTPFSPGQSTAPQKSDVLTKLEYIEQQTPRITGLPHTAPLFDAVTTPVEAPEPIGCITSKKTGCRCYTQQGTEYQTTPVICQQIMTRGIFLPWKSSAKPTPETPSPKEQKPRETPVAFVLPNTQVPNQLSETKAKTPG